MAKSKVDIKKVTQEEGTIQVTRTTVVSGKETEKEIENEKVTVRPFICQPAYVSVEVGEMVPLAQPRAGRKIDINVSYPCYKEEMPQVLRDVTDFVNDYLDKEVSMIDGAAIPKEYKKKESKHVDKPEAEEKEVEDVHEEKPKEKKTRTRRKKADTPKASGNKTAEKKVDTKKDLTKEEKDDLDDLLAELEADDAIAEEVDDPTNVDSEDNDEEDDDLLADLL